MAARPPVCVATALAAEIFKIFRREMRDMFPPIVVVRRNCACSVVHVARRGVALPEGLHGGERPAECSQAAQRRMRIRFFSPNCRSNLGTCRRYDWKGHDMLRRNARASELV